MRRILLSAALLLAACSGGGSSSVPAPVINSFTASQSAIDVGGGTFLHFDVTGATQVQIDQGVGDVSGRTSAAVAPISTTTYKLTATNPGGSANASVTVTVNPLAAQLLSFTADPPTAVSGQPVTLRWTAKHAVGVSLSAAPSASLPQPAATDAQIVVHPTQSTRYTLTIAGANGTAQPAPLSVAVLVASVPTVTLASDATSVARGTSTLLHWTSNIPATFTLVTRPHDGPMTRTALGTVNSASVRPVGDTDYSIDAMGPGGSSTSNTVTLTVTGGPAAGFSWSPAVPGSADAAMLRLNSIAGNVVTLDLVATKAIDAGALALELPLDGAAAGSRDGSSRVVLDGALAGDVAPGLTVNVVALDPGASPAAATAALPSSGSAAGVLLIGAAQKPVCSGCAGGVAADKSWTPGTVIASVRLRLVPAGGAGLVFAPDALRGFRSAVRSGTTGATLGTIAVGTLAAN